MSPEGRSGFWETYRGPSSDPRTIVTHAAFSVHPDLLGIPLAQHPRRVAAMLVDLLLIALVTQAGGLLLGILAVVFLFRVTFRKKTAGAPSLMGTAFRGVVGCFGAVVLLVTVIVLWSAVSSRTGGRDSPGRAAVEAPEEVRTVGAPDLTASEDLPPDDAADAFPEVPPELADSLALLEQRLDDEIRRRLEAERAAEDVRDELREARREARRFAGVRAFLRRIADDLGVGFGWAALYFTVFTTWWKGRTPGKRLMRLRVVRLSGDPLNWWDSFERFGGYTAGFATGLLGFFQVYWDPNRQAIHDRIGRTVVIQDGKPPVPGNWHVEAGPAPPPRSRAGFTWRTRSPSEPPDPEETR